MEGNDRSVPPRVDGYTIPDSLVAGWQHRQRLLNFCTATVEQDLREKQRLVQGQEPELDRRPITSFFEEEVLVSLHRVAV